MYVRTHEMTTNNVFVIRDLPFESCSSHADGGAIFTQFDNNSTNLALSLLNLSFNNTRSTAGTVALWNHADLANSSLTIQSTLFTRNYAAVGAGLFIYTESMTNSTLSVSDFTSLNNTAELAGAGITLMTAHMLNSHASFVSTTFDNTNVTVGPGAAYALLTTEMINSNITIDTVDIKHCNCSSGLISMNQRSLRDPVLPGFVDHLSYKNKVWSNAQFVMNHVNLQNNTLVRGPIDVNLRDTLAIDSSVIVSDIVSMFNNVSATVGVASFAFAPQHALTTVSNQPVRRQSGLAAGMTLQVDHGTFQNNTVKTAFGGIVVKGYANVLLEDVLFQYNSAPLGDLLSIVDAGDVRFSAVTMYLTEARDVVLVPFMTISNVRSVSVESQSLYVYSRTSNVYLRLTEWDEVTGSLSNMFAGPVSASASMLGSYQHVHGTAVQCPYGFYTVVGSGLNISTAQSLNSSTDTCISCPDHAECFADKIAAAAGFWSCANSNASATEIVLCPPGVCLGNNTCRENRIQPASANVLCGQCAPGYTPNGADCLKCNRSAGWILFVVVNVIILAAYLWMCMQSYIFMNYTQALFLLFGPNSSWNPVFLLTFLQPINVAEQFCLGLDKPIDVMTARLVIPFIYIVGVGLALVIYDYHTRSIGTLLPVIWRVWLILLYVIFMTLMEQAMQYLTFVNICNIGSVLSEYPNVFYLSNEHKPFAGLAVIIIIVIVILMWKLYYFLKHVESLRVKQPLSLVETKFYEGAQWLILPFRRDYYMWHLLDYFRRTMLLIGYVVFWRQNIARTLWLSCWIVFFAVYQTWCLPWRRFRDNLLDAVSWWVLAFLAFAELANYSLDGQTQYAYGVEIFSVIYIPVFLIFGIKWLAEPTIRLLERLLALLRELYARMLFNREQRKEQAAARRIAAAGEAEARAMEQRQYEAERARVQAVGAAPAQRALDPRALQQPARPDEFAAELPALKAKLRPTRTLSEDVAAQEQQAPSINPLLASVFENRHRRATALEEVEARVQVKPVNETNVADTPWNKDLLRQAVPAPKPVDDEVAPWAKASLRPTQPQPLPLASAANDQADTDASWVKPGVRPAVAEEDGYMDVYNEPWVRSEAKKSLVPPQVGIPATVVSTPAAGPAPWTVTPLRTTVEAEEPAVLEAKPLARVVSPPLKAVTPQLKSTADPRKAEKAEDAVLDEEWNVVRAALKESGALRHDPADDQTREQVPPHVQQAIAQVNTPQPTVSPRTQLTDAIDRRASGPSPWARSVMRKEETKEENPAIWRRKLSSVAPVEQPPTPVTPTPVPAVALKAVTPEAVRRASKPAPASAEFRVSGFNKTSSIYQDAAPKDDDVDDDAAAQELEDWSRVRK